MANLVQADMITKVRRRLDEITIGGEVAITDIDVQDLASSNFSDNDLQNRLNDAARNLAARVKAQYLPDLIETVETTRFHDYQSNRILGSRIKVASTEYGEQVATRRTFLGNRKLNSSGRTTTTQFPVYVYEDAILKILPDPVDAGSTTTATADLVRTPGSFFGTTLNQSNVAITELDERFSEAITQRVLFYCYITLGLVELAQRAQRAYIKEISPFILRRSRTDASQQ